MGLQAATLLGEFFLKKIDSARPGIWNPSNSFSGMQLNASIQNAGFEIRASRVVLHQASP